MSNFSPDQAEFDFWEFVSCAKCRLPFNLDNGAPTVPFWLTECGHVVCNSHLNPDQSCSQCGARDIQLAPLQREMESPMSEWFQSLPRALDAVAFATKFQQDSLASQLRYYRSRHQQFRQVIDRLKREVSELKKDNNALREENEHYRLEIQRKGDNQYFVNANGKRQMASTQQVMTGSSPRSTSTPVGPSRLTLQSGQQVPELYAQDSNSRPISSRSLEQYAYKAPESKFHPPTLTHIQSAARTFQRTQVPQKPSQNVPQSSNDRTAMPPPSRFKPVQTISSSRNNGTGQPIQRQVNMGPPPIPQHHIQQGSSLSRASSNRFYIPPPSNQAVPLTSSGQHSSASMGPQRFFSSEGSGSVLRTSISRASNVHGGT